MTRTLLTRLRKVENRLERKAHLMAEPRVVLYLPDNGRDPKLPRSNLGAVQIYQAGTRPPANREEA
jgi:hypothetical protein